MKQPLTPWQARIKAWWAAWGHPWLFVHSVVMLVLSPLIMLKLMRIQYRKHKNISLDWSRCFARRFSKAEPVFKAGCPNVVMVFHGHGEMLMADHLGRMLREVRPEVNLIWSPMFREIADNAALLHPDFAVIQFPFDWSGGIAGWLFMIRPDVVVVVERTWQFTMLLGARNFGARTILVNGLTRKRNRRWDWFSNFTKRKVLQSYNTICMRSEEHAERLLSILPQNADLKVPGSIKFGLSPLPIPEADACSLRAWMEAAPQPIIIAGSSRIQDEPYLFEAFDKVRARRPCTLLMAPRQMDRFETVFKMCLDRGYKVARRSEYASNKLSPGAVPPEEAEILLLDTWGELARVYPYGVVAFIGNTFAGAGHNVIEPVAAGIPVVYGPRRGVFEGEQKLCEAAGIGFRIKTADELAEVWLRAVGDAEFREDQRRRCRELWDDQKKAMEITFEALLAQVDAAMPRRA